MERLRVRIPAGTAGEFSSPGLTLCVDSHPVSLPSPCYRSGTQKTSVILPKTHTPLTQRSPSGLSMPLSRHSVRTYSEMSSHAVCQGPCGHSRLSPISHCGLILTLKSGSVCASQSPLKKKQKQRRRGILTYMGRTFSRKSSQAK